MKKPFLEVTYRGGKPFAAYLYLDRRADDHVARTDRQGAFAVDYSADGRPIGVEFIDARHVDLPALNALLQSLHQASVAESDIAPLLAA